MAQKRRLRSNHTTSYILSKIPRIQVFMLLKYKYRITFNKISYYDFLQIPLLKS